MSVKPYPIILTILFVLVSVTSAESYLVSKSANDFLQDGIQYYESGNFAEAIKHLSKALVMDPSNHEANEYLSKLVNLDNPEAQPLQQRVQRFKELLEYISFLENRINYLEDKNEHIKDALTNQDGYDSLLMQSIQLIETETEPKRYADDSNLSDLEIDQMNQALNEKKRYLVNETILLQKRHNKLKNLKSKAVKDAPLENQYIQSVNENIKLREELAEVQHKSRQKEEHISSQKKEINELKSDLSDIKAEIKDMQGLIKDSEKQVSKLTKQLTKASLDNVQKERMLGNSAATMSELNSALEEAEQRLNLVQRIMREKDDKIKQLEKVVDKTEQSRAVQKQMQIDSISLLRNEFKQLEASLNKKVEISADKINALEQLTAEQEKRLALYQLELKAKNAQVEVVKGELVQKQTEITSLNRTMDIKDTKLIQFDGIVEIYRAKLTETNRELREKIERINELENKVTRMNIR